MKITILVEGKTEKAFKPHLVDFLKLRLAGRMPLLDFFARDGRIDKGEKLRRTVENLLTNGKSPSDAVIALTDVYTGANDFIDAADAKRKMFDWAGNNSKFQSSPFLFQARDATRILRGKDLAFAANKCPELKAFLNTILTLSGTKPL